jgi:hydroxymethylbilane synthase
MKRPFRLATRGSRLALWQARWVSSLLRRHHPGLAIELVVVSSTGDGDHATPLYRMGNVGVFVKEVQQALADDRADAGVHSMKDLPTSEPDGLAIAAVLEREDPRDALIGAAGLPALPAGALVGTSSLRRQAQLAAARPDLRFASIRGNVETRLRKVREHDEGIVATIMAWAGLKRLGLLRAAGAVPLDPFAESTPAPAQGAVAVDCRAGDRRARTLLACLHHRETATAVAIERTVLAGLAGGCSLPLGCLALRDAVGWRLRLRLGRGAGLVELDERGAASELPTRALRALGH